MLQTEAAEIVANELVISTLKCSDNIDKNLFILWINNILRTAKYKGKISPQKLEIASDLTRHSKEEYFKDAFALHFCSVCLDDYPIKKAHYKAIEYAKRNNCLISFDLNIRLGLFKDHQKLKATILEFIGYSNIVKLSIEELEWLGVESVNSLFVNDVKMIVLTLGKDGSKCYLKDGTIIKSKGIKVDAVDTTGAGDGFVGSFLYQLSNNKENLDEISKDKIQKYMDFSNRFCSLSVTKKGAIDSYPNKEEMKRII